MLKEKVLTEQNNPLNSDYFVIKKDGNVLRVISTGSVGATLEVRLYPAGTLPRQMGRPLPILVSQDPVLTVSAGNGEVKRADVPSGSYDYLVVLNGRPVNAGTVTFNPINGPLGHGLLLTLMGVLAYWRG